MKRTALKRRGSKPIRRAGGAVQNPKYLDFIRRSGCVLASTGDCVGAVEAAHVGDRGLSQKCRDEEAIPLCGYHHRTGPDSQHVMGKNFWGHHGINRADLVTMYHGIYQGTGAGSSKA
jgi:hypothetical protein